MRFTPPEIKTLFRSSPFQTSFLKSLKGQGIYLKETVYFLLVMVRPVHEKKQEKNGKPLLNTSDTFSENLNQLVVA